MATVIIPPTDLHEQRVVMRNVSWQTYESILADHVDARSPRFTYCEGTLEIMSPSSEHEEVNLILASIAEILAEERGLEFRALGSTTFRRADLERGTEPDSCFYFQSVEHIRGKKKIDLAMDPPPDLVIEVEVTNPALPKLPVYARLGVPEVWVYDLDAVRIFHLQGDRYVAGHNSGIFADLSDSVLSDFMRQSRTLTTLAWRRLVRSWAGTPR